MAEEFAVNFPELIDGELDGSDYTKVCPYCEEDKVTLLKEAIRNTTSILETIYVLKEIGCDTCRRKWKIHTTYQPEIGIENDEGEMFEIE